MLVVLSLSLATVVMGTTGLSLVSSVFAGGNHHDDGGKKCKDNDNNNCNDTHKTQKIKEKNYCEIENKNKIIVKTTLTKTYADVYQRWPELEGCRTD